MDEQFLTTAAEDSIDARRLEAGLDRSLRDSLGPVSLGLFIGMSLLAISYSIFQQPEIASTMTLTTALCALYFLLGHLLVSRGRVPVWAGNPLGLAGVAVLTLNSLLHMYLSGDPAQTTNFALVLIGAGIFFLTPGWYTTAITLVIGGWWITSWVMGQGPAWFHFNFLMVLAGLVSVMSFYLRRRSLLRLEELRLQDERQRQMLKEAARQAQENLLALRQAKEAAEAANRSKTTFLNMMSHDLRTPLTVILGYSEMLHAQAELDGDAQMASRMEQVESAGKHLLSMLNDILDYARLESEQVQISSEPVQPAAVAVQVADAMLRRIQKRGNQLELAIEPDLGEMNTDPNRLYQMLGNLLSHAARSTENGVLRFAGRREVDAAGEAWVVFDVSDDGPGLSQEEAARLFEPFPSGDLQEALRSGRPAQGEIQVGLAVSQRLCRLLGGELTVQSATGMGTVFTARLPAGGRLRSG
jgi:signal transduction histidine kinase